MMQKTIVLQVVDIGRHRLKVMALKVSDKNLRKIVVDGHAFSWIINETQKAVTIRCYNMKSTYIELIFTWEEMWEINLHKPVVVSAIIKKAIESGWNYRLGNQVVSIQSPESKEWIIK